MDRSWIVYRLGDICTIERCRGGVYKKDTIYLQVSATDKKIRILDHDAILESKYVAIEPKRNIKINRRYLFLVLESTEEAFFSRYVGSNINIQVDCISLWEFPAHTDENTQQAYVQWVNTINTTYERERALIEELKELKQGSLRRLFPRK